MCCIYRKKVLDKVEIYNWKIYKSGQPQKWPMDHGSSHDHFMGYRRIALRKVRPIVELRKRVTGHKSSHGPSFTMINWFNDAEFQYLRESSKCGATKGDQRIIGRPTVYTTCVHFLCMKVEGPTLKKNSKSWHMEGTYEQKVEPWSVGLSFLSKSRLIFYLLHPRTSFSINKVCKTRF